jgi:hypothetical protein
MSPRRNHRPQVPRAPLGMPSGPPFCQFARRPRYVTILAAGVALEKLMARIAGNGGLKPGTEAPRIYRCERCYDYHVTTEPKRGRE